MQLGRDRRKSLGSKVNKVSTISEEAGMVDRDGRKGVRVAIVET